MTLLRLLTLLLLLPFLSPAQTWNPVGGGFGNDDHGLSTWNGYLVAGGSFNNNPCDKVAKWDGTTWSCFGNGIGSVVRCVISWNGYMVACGDFWNTNQPCTDCNGIAYWDGTQWLPLGTGFNNDVLTMCVYNGDLIAAGDFTTADGNPCERVARWNGSAWVQFAPGIDNDVRALAVYNNELWIGGDFANAGGDASADRVAKWNGTNWEDVDIPNGLDSTVRALYVFNNEIYVGGHFITLGANTNCAGIAKYDGANWTALGTGTNSYVRAIHSYNGNLIAGGDFTMAGSTAANRVAKWDGTNWIAMGTGMNDYIRAFTVYAGELYAGGAFVTADGNTCTYIARWYEPPPPAIAAFTVNDQTVCAGSCVNYTDQTLNSPTSWQWTFPGGNPSTSTQQNPSVCYDTAGTYNVTLIAANATSSDTLTFTSYISVASLPNADAGPSDTICSGWSTQLFASGGVSYQWIPSTGLSCSNCASPIANPTSTTTYAVIVTNAAGCQATDFAIVHVEICTDVNDLSGPQQLNVYPNPVSGTATVNLPNAEHDRLVICDLSGREMKSYATTGQSNVQISSEELAAGMYLLKLVKGEEILGTGKLLVR